MYQLFLPAKPLQPFIECYWRFEGFSTALEQSIFVDAKPDILFNFGGAYQRTDLLTPLQKETLTIAHLDAQRDYPLQVAQHGRVQLIGVRFYAGGLSAFVSMSLHELLNQVIDLRLIFGSAVLELEARLYEADSRAQVALLNGFFLQHLRPSQAHLYIRLTAREIEMTNGAVDIGTLSKQSGYSIRTLDRYFQQFYGVSPKFYARIQRFQHALIRLSQPLSLAEIALMCGYYDQAHFTKEFSQFTGQSPYQYRRNEPYSVQFLQES
jgi:AraC-like DNA-binding protein